MRTVAFAGLVQSVGKRAGNGAIGLPVYSVTKHAGFVPSLEYFKKQVFSRSVEDYRKVEAGEFAYATIHLDEGSIGIAPERCLISPMYTVFAVDADQVDSRYLIRFLKSPRALSTYAALGRGAVHRRKAISLDALGTVQVPLPPLDEQRRIAAILEQADALRVKRRQVLAHLDALTQSIFLDMIPSATSTEVVGDLAIAIRTGPFGSQLLHGEFVDQGVAVLGLDNVVGNEFRWAGRRYITPDKYKTLKRYTVYPGDVLISIMGTTGRCAVVPDDIPIAINTKHICAITLDTSRARPEFVRAAFLWSPIAREHLRRQTKGSIMAGLNMGIVKAMPIPVPPMVLQEQFEQRSARLTAARALAMTGQVRDDELFTSVQSRAFRGELW